MALIKCQECNGEVSDTAKSCPQCGAEVDKPASTTKVVVVGVVLLFLVGWVYNAGSDSRAGPPPAPSAAQIANEAEFKAVVIGAAALKAASKNPKSFKLESAVKMASGAICYEYRGTNSFNAIVPGNAVFILGVGSSKPADWNKHCAGKSGIDFTHARQAI